MTTVGMTNLEMLGEHVMPGDVARVPIMVSGSILGMGSTAVDHRDGAHYT